MDIVIKTLAVAFVLVILAGMSQINTPNQLSLYFVGVFLLVMISFLIVIIIDYIKNKKNGKKEVQ